MTDAPKMTLEHVDEVEYQAERLVAMSARPIRVQLSRAKGWRMPENTVSVARPGRWGNPFRIGDFGIPDAAAAVQRFREWRQGRVVGPPVTYLTELRGKNLACWCPLDAPCHADVLLELANTPVGEA